MAELSSCDRDMGPVKPGVFTLWPLMVSVALKQPFRGGEGRGCRAGLFLLPRLLPQILSFLATQESSLGTNETSTFILTHFSVSVMCRHSMFSCILLAGHLRHVV